MMRILIVLITSLLVSPAFAQAPPSITGYCDGVGCPTKYTIEGFEVRVSPEVFQAADFSNTTLGQALENLQARILAFAATSVRKNANRILIDTDDLYLSVVADDIFPSVIEQLRAVPVTFYIQPTTMEGDAYSNCSSSSCYIPAAKRIVFSLNRLALLIHGDMMITHEFAHAYHDRILRDGLNNSCVKKIYEKAVTSGGLYRSVKNAGYAREPGNLLTHATVENYAATNHLEYFAIGAEAYLSGNARRYPYDRSDLFDYDVDGFLLQWGVWAMGDPQRALNPDCREDLFDFFFRSSQSQSVIQEPPRLLN